MSTTTIDQLIEGLDAPQRESVLKALADAHVSAQDPFLAVMLAVSYKIAKQNEVFKAPARMGGGGVKGIMAGAVAGGVAAYVSAVMLFDVVKKQTDVELARMSNEIRENGQLLADLRDCSGELRYYPAEYKGKSVRILTIDSGATKPTEAYINASGAATVILPALTKPQNQ